MLGDFMAELMQREDAYERAYPGARMSALASCRPVGKIPGAQCQQQACCRSAMPRPRWPGEPVFVDTSVLIAAEDAAGGALYAATLEWLDLLWRSRSGAPATGAGGVPMATTAALPCRRAMPAPPSAVTRPGRPGRPTPPRWRRPGPCRPAMPGFGDCLAVACAQHSGCNQMLSLHLPHGHEFGGVTVVHPQAVRENLEA
jgi:hypothetical protein